MSTERKEKNKIATAAAIAIDWICKNSCTYTQMMWNGRSDANG